MNTTQTQAIDELLAGIQAKWGKEALQPLVGVARQSNFISTGFLPLDTALGTGGIPRNRLTTLYGKPTSGMTTLAYSLIAQAQANQLVTVYLDVPHIFDPEYVAFRHVDMDMLLLIRPGTWAQALEMVRDVVNVAVAGLLVFDVGAPDPQSSEARQSLAATLQRVGALLPQSTWTVVVLVPVDLSVRVDSGASLRLMLERRNWLFDDDVLRGYQVQITVLKNKFGSVSETVTLDMALGG